MPRTIRQLKKDRRTKERKQADFLSIFSDCASVSVAARKSKVPRSNIYMWLKEEGMFKELYEAACEEAVGALEDEAVRRAYAGTLKPVFQGGKRVGAIREYSDTLLIVLLKARAPEKYKERTYNEQTGPNGKPIQTQNSTTVFYIPNNKRDPNGPGS